MENIFVKNLLNGQELSDDMLDGVAGGAVYTPEQVEQAKELAREMGATEEQIAEYEKKAKEMGLI